MGDLVIVSKLADLENVPYYGELKLSSGTTNPIEEKNSCVLTGYDITIQAHDYQAIRCYNSAVYKSTNEQEFYIFCPLSEPNYLMIWKTGSIFSYSRYNNVQYENVYLDTLNYGPITADGATFPYFNYSLDYVNVGGENNVKWIDSLPVFDNLQNFVDYVTAPLEPRGEATCKVTYFLPDDTYEYTKLTYKKNVQPESVNDGTIVNLDPTQDSVTVEGLIENASYWFKIFTNKSESEAFPYTVEVDPVPPEYKTYIEWINGNGNLFKKLTYNQNSINSYTYQGTTYYHKITIDPKQTSFLQKVYTMDYDTSSVTKWGVENYTYQGYTGIYYNRASSVNQLLTLEINSAETEGLYTLSIPQLTMSYLISTDMVPDLLITQNGEFYKISGTTSGYDTQRSKTVTSNLEGIFKFIWHHFHNVNIKVDGVYWSKVN